MTATYSIGSKLWLDKRLCDITLVCGLEDEDTAALRAHKNVLCAASETFAACLLSDVHPEARTNTVRVRFETRIVELCLEAVYQGPTVLNKADPLLLVESLPFFDYYLLDELFDAAHRSINRTLFTMPSWEARHVAARVLHIMTTHPAVATRSDGQLAACADSKLDLVLLNTGDALAVFPLLPPHATQFASVQVCREKIQTHLPSLHLFPRLQALFAQLPDTHTQCFAEATQSSGSLATGPGGLALAGWEYSDGVCLSFHDASNWSAAQWPAGRVYLEYQEACVDINHQLAAGFLVVPRSSDGKLRVGVFPVDKSREWKRNENADALWPYNSQVRGHVLLRIDIGVRVRKGDAVSHTYTAYRELAPGRGVQWVPLTVTPEEAQGGDASHTFVLVLRVEVKGAVPANWPHGTSGVHVDEYDL